MVAILRPCCRIQMRLTPLKWSTCRLLILICFCYDFTLYSLSLSLSLHSILLLLFSVFFFFVCFASVFPCYCPSRVLFFSSFRADLFLRPIRVASSAPRRLSYGAVMFFPPFFWTPADLSQLGGKLDSIDFPPPLSITNFNIRFKMSTSKRMNAINQHFSFSLSFFVSFSSPAFLLLLFFSMEIFLTFFFSGWCNDYPGTERRYLKWFLSAFVALSLSLSVYFVFFDSISLCYCSGEGGRGEGRGWGGEKRNKVVSYFQ